MFCCLVIFALALSGSESKDDRRGRILASIGAICAFLGTVASLSDQTLIALITLGCTFVLVRKGNNGAARTLLWSSVVVGLLLYVASAQATRWTNESFYSGDPMGTSISERWFHARYGFSLLVEQPASMVVGIGPGRYGDYAVRTGYFPSTVTPQSLITEWAVGYGALGVLLIGLWLFRIGSHAVSGHGTLGTGILAALLVANMFQANWMWEAWFLALAFLHASAHAPTLEPARA